MRIEISWITGTRCRKAFYRDEYYHFIKYVRLVFFITVFILSTRCMPQEKIDYFELNLDELGKVVITASKTPRYINLITQKVDVINAETKDLHSENRNLSELFMHLPGASVRVLSRNDANWGSYGGIGPKYNTYLLNGIAVDGFIDPMNISQESIQRIEVQRGPASILYPNYLSQDFAGVQSPLAGTINLVLKDHIPVPITDIKLEFGRFNTLAGYASHQSRIGNLSFISGISHELSDYINYGTSNSWMDMQKEPQYNKTKAFFNSTIRLNENHLFHLFFNYTLHKGDIGRETREFSHNYSLINFDYTVPLSATLRLSAKAGLRAYSRSFQNDNKQSGTGLYVHTSTDFIKQNIIPIDFSVAFNHLQNSVLTFGLDYQIGVYETSNEPVGNSRQLMNDATANNLGIYLQEEFLIDDLTIRGGLRHNRTDYIMDKLQGNEPGLRRQHWLNYLWSFGVKYRISEKGSIYANTGNSFTPPSLKSSGGTIQCCQLKRKNGGGVCKTR